MCDNPSRSGVVFPCQPLPCFIVDGGVHTSGGGLLTRNNGERVMNSVCGQGARAYDSGFGPVMGLGNTAIGASGEA